jgi:hypothetical protein
MYLTHGRGRDQHRSTRQRSLAATELRLCIAPDHRTLSGLVLCADLARYCRHWVDRNPTRLRRSVQTADDAITHSYDLCAQARRWTSGTLDPH